MKDWKSLEYAALCAKTERDKRKAHFAIIKLLEKDQRLHNHQSVMPIVPVPDPISQEKIHVR